MIDIMKEIKNFFIASVEYGDFAIENGILSVNEDYLIGQYIYIPGAVQRSNEVVGSVLNEGIYLAQDTLITLAGVQDEVWTGAVCGLAIPQDFIELANEIAVFQAEASKSPATGALQSESYGGYQYARAVAASGLPATWRDVYAGRLNKYRRLSMPQIL